MTTVRQRGFYHGLFKLPTLINIFCTSFVANDLYYSGNWRWGYGQQPIIAIACVVLLLAGLCRPQLRLVRSESYQKYLDDCKQLSEGASALQKCERFCIEIDTVGCLLLVGGLAMLLLPFVLVDTWGGWTSCKKRKFLRRRAANCIYIHFTSSQDIRYLDCRMYQLDSISYLGAQIRQDTRFFTYPSASEQDGYMPSLRYRLQSSPRLQTDSTCLLTCKWPAEYLLEKLRCLAVATTSHTLCSSWLWAGWWWKRKRGARTYGLVSPWWLWASVCLFQPACRPRAMH